MNKLDQVSLVIMLLIALMMAALIFVQAQAAAPPVYLPAVGNWKNPTTLCDAWGMAEIGMSGVWVTEFEPSGSSYAHPFVCSSDGQAEVRLIRDDKYNAPDPMWGDFDMLINGERVYMVDGVYHYTCQPGDVIRSYFWIGKTGCMATLEANK